MDIIKKDSKLYILYYEVEGFLGLESSRIRERFITWESAKQCALEVLGYTKDSGILYWCTLKYPVNDIEKPNPQNKRTLRNSVCYGFKPNKKYARIKEIWLNVSALEITPEELNELRSLSL